MVVVTVTELVIHIPLLNSGNLPVLVKKVLTIGAVDEVKVVERGDSLWSGEESEAVRVCQTRQQDRWKDLANQLQFGNGCSKRQVSLLKELLCKYNSVFALDDSELGETDMVTHSIDTGNAPSVRANPRRLPYVLHKELEKQMEAQMETGCIEPSSKSLLFTIGVSA